MAVAGCGGGDDADGPLPLPGLDPYADDPPSPLALPPGVSPEDVAPLSPPAAAAEELPAPDLVDAAHLAGFGEDSLRVFVLAVDDGYDEPSFQGVVITCQADSVEATVAHGLFPPPPARGLRTSVEGAGDPELFGPARPAPPALGVPHETLLLDPEDVGRLVRAAFVPGAVVSNGHSAFRNAVPADQLEAALGEVLACPALAS